MPILSLCKPLIDKKLGSKFNQKLRNKPFISLLYTCFILDYFRQTVFNNAAAISAEKLLFLPLVSIKAKYLRLRMFFSLRDISTYINQLNLPDLLDQFHGGVTIDQEGLGVIAELQRLQPLSH